VGEKGLSRRSEFIRGAWGEGKLTAVEHFGAAAVKDVVLAGLRLAAFAC
jgi:hypothetical protein